MTPCILRIFRYYRSQSKSSVGRRGVVDCTTLRRRYWLKWQNETMADLTFQKLANEAERKYPKKKFASFLLFWQVQISKTLPNWQETCQNKSVVRNDPKVRLLKSVQNLHFLVPQYAFSVSVMRHDKPQASPFFCY